MCFCASIIHNGQGIKSLFSENGIGWNSEGQTGTTRRRADLDKLRIPADEREATHLEIIEVCCFALCVFWGGVKMFRQRSDPFERWRGITIEYLLLPGLTAYLYAVLWQKGNLYLIFMLYFMFFFISSLISLLSSLCLRYMIFGYPVKQIIKRMLSFFLIIAMDILFYKVVVRIISVYFPELFISELFFHWRFIWCSSALLRWGWDDYFLLRSVLIE